MGKKAAFLLFPGFEALDFYGPVSVLGSRKLNEAYQILTVSETAGPVANSLGISTVTEYDFRTCPKPDILVLVGKPASCHWPRLTQHRVFCVILLCQA